MHWEQEMACSLHAAWSREFMFLLRLLKICLYKMFDWVASVIAV